MDHEMRQALTGRLRRFRSFLVHSSAMYPPPMLMEQADLRTHDDVMAVLARRSLSAAGRAPRRNP